MNGMSALLKNDLKLGLRYGFFTIYGVLSLLYIVIVRFLPEGIQVKGLQLFIFTDPVVLGFYFIGGAVLFEKSERVLETLFVSPVKLTHYLFSKALNFSFLSLIVSFLLVVGGYGFDFRPVMLFLAVGLTSFAFTFLGLVVVSKKETVAEYLIYSILYLLPLFVPLLGFFNLADGRWLYLFPTQATLLLLQGSFGTISDFDLIYSILYLSALGIFCGVWAKRWFEKYVIQKTGGEK